jgi:hypothetical protein
LTSLFSYVIASDTGFAPNPFGGVCTLATCKPAIRRVARPGDWILGTGSTATAGASRLVYAMSVSEVLPIEAYGADPRFQRKIPSLTGAAWRRCGDNIYHVDGIGEWHQRRSPFHGPRHRARDLSGRNVLIGREFYYFGQAAVELPPRLRALIKIGRGHKRVRESETIDAFERWLRRTFTLGRLGRPSDSRWPSAVRCRGRSERSRAPDGGCGC